MESERSEEVFKPNVDTSQASRQVWLVKVPKYLAQSLQSAQPMQEIGRILIDKKDVNFPQISFNLSEAVARSQMSDDKENIQFVAIEHKFHISEVDSQTMSIFFHNEESNHVSIEGIVEQKGEFRPKLTTNYINLSKERIKRKTEPLRRVQCLDRTVTVFRPVAVSTPKKKESPIKKFKKDRETVRNMLFELFEKHQYYYMKDLERLTQQPVYYLKEILREMCIYNTKNPHQYMWELRPEFRHYANTRDVSKQSDN